MTATLAAKEITNDELEQRFDNGEDVLEYCDLDNPVVQAPISRDDAQRQINISVPAWLVDFMDDEASRRGISRKAVINDWLVDRADQERLHRAAISRAS